MVTFIICAIIIAFIVFVAVTSANEKKRPKPVSRESKPDGSADVDDTYTFSLSIETLVGICVDCLTSASLTEDEKVSVFEGYEKAIGNLPTADRDFVVNSIILKSYEYIVDKLSKEQSDELAKVKKRYDEYAAIVNSGEAIRYYSWGLIMDYTTDYTPYVPPKKARKAAKKNVAPTKDKFTFTAFDVETATEQRASLCQIGIVRVENGEIVEEVCHLVKPIDNIYSDYNQAIHNISSSDTKSSPELGELWERIRPYFHQQRVLAHNISFDLSVLNKSLELYGIEPVAIQEKCCTYLLYKRKLKDLCAEQGVELDHHNALSDARACARLYLNYLNGVRAEASPPVARVASKRVKMPKELLVKDLSNADPANPFYDKKVVLTGTLDGYARIEAAELLKKLGADVNTSISLRTAIVLAGSDAGPSKMKKIDELNASGASIHVMDEKEFSEILKKYS